MAEALRPLLEKIKKKAARSASAPARPRPPAPSRELSATVSAKTLIGEVAPVRGAKRVSPTPPMAAGKAARERRATALAFDPCASDGKKPHAFVITRDEPEIAGYRADLGPLALTTLEAKRFLPARELDLHGQRMRGFEARLVRALEELHARKVKSVLLIHGKGLHSPRGEGVLLESVLAALTGGQAARFVRAFRTAPSRLGGSGALLVSLDR